MTSREWTQEVQTCPLCGKGGSRLFDRREFRNQPVINRICTTCGLVFQSPAPTDDELDSFYQREYRRLYQGTESPIAKDLAVQRGRAESLKRFMAVHTSRLESHLDIGCSTGLLLKTFQEEFGSRPVGIEPGDSYRDYARGMGLPVYRSLDELIRAGNKPFELVSLAHVLEHIRKPVKYLEDIRRNYLAPSGYLLVEVPNLYAHDSFEVAHLISFSPHSLVQTVRKAGYEVIALEKHGKPRSEVLPLYITLLASPAAAAIDYLEYVPEPERSVALKRQAGMLQRRLMEKLVPGRAWKPVDARQN